MADQPDYKSYLLRLWQAQSPTGPVWRASLEDPHTGIRLGFATLQRLHQFLVEHTSGGRPDQEAVVASRVPLQP